MDVCRTVAALSPPPSPICQAAGCGVHRPGPTRARTSIRDNLVVVLLEDTLTKGERRLVAKGRDMRVLDYRAEFQAAMREDAIASIEELTGRKVMALMSANHIDPDLAAEFFVLEPDGEAASSDGR
jgi:uncharacterized protein YbcI